MGSDGGRRVSRRGGAGAGTSGSRRTALVAAALLLACAAGIWLVSVRSEAAAEAEARGSAQMERSSGRDGEGPTGVSTGAVRVVCISDTHDMHDGLEEGEGKGGERGEALPEGDILIHAGDFSNRGSREEIAAFDAWLGAHKERFPGGIFVVPGNMDIGLQRMGMQAAQGAFENAELLVDRRVTARVQKEDGVREVTLLGTPWTPKFVGAYQLEDDAEAAEVWAEVLEDDPSAPPVDILITHGPPAGVLDATSRGQHIGCPRMLEAVQAWRQPPKLWVFGHVHASYGVVDGTEVPGTGLKQTTFVNAAQYNALTGHGRRADSIHPVVVDV